MKGFQTLMIETFAPLTPLLLMSFLTDVAIFAASVFDIAEEVFSTTNLTL